MLAPWRKPFAIHDPGKVILDLAVSLALGGDALADVAVLRAEPGVYGQVASDATVSRLVTLLADDADAAVAAIGTARRAARAAVWALAGADAPDVAAASPVVIDLDATLVTAHSEKEHAKATLTRVRVPSAAGVRRSRGGRHRGDARDRAAGGCQMVCVRGGAPD